MSKKIKNVYLSKVNYSFLYEAYIEARRVKRYRNDVIKFSFKFEDNLNMMVEKLRNLEYRFSEYNMFYVYEPEKRKILAAKFKDRIVHTWYVKSFIEPIFAPTFVNTSYACIKEKGMHKCCEDVRKAIYNCNKKYVDENGKCKGYIIKMDVAKFFQNIDRRVLYKIIARKIKDERLLGITEDILNSSSMYDEISDVSLPIGNYTSQMFANIYLNEVDQYAKHKLKCKYYYRYMDGATV